MYIEFYLEEPSAEEVLKAILPKILPDDVGFDLHVFEGKDDLFNKLPNRLKAYRHWLPADWRIMVLVDEDRQNCRKLKEKLEKVAHKAGLVTKSSATPNNDFQVVNRLAIEELEAWFFGDIEALRAAYPRVSRHLQNQRKYRNPDEISGGTYEALKRLLIRKNYYQEELSKREVAQNIAKHMEPTRNSSKSFQVFMEGLKACVE